MVEALPREAASEPGPVTSLREQAGHLGVGWRHGVRRLTRPGGREAHIFSPNPPDGLRGGHSQPRSKQGDRGPASQWHVITGFSPQPSGGPLHGRCRQLSRLRVQKPGPHSLRGRGEVIATALSMVSGHQVSPEEALFPGAVPA